MLGTKVKIMLDWDTKGKQGATMPLSDQVTVHVPKDEDELVRPFPTITPADIDAPISAD